MKSKFLSRRQFLQIIAVGSMLLLSLHVKATDVASVFTLLLGMAGTLAEEMRRDARTFHLSTDAPPPLVDEFGEARVRGTPIAEGALTGMAIGAAGSGYRPIVDWRSITFAGLWSKWRGPFVATKPASARRMITSASSHRS